MQSSIVCSSSTFTSTSSHCCTTKLRKYWVQCWAMLSKTSEGDVLSARNRLVDCDVCLTWQPPLNGTVIGQFHLATDHYRCLHTGVLSHSSCQYTLVLIASSATNAPGATFVFFCFGAQTFFKLRASLFPLLSSQSQSQFGWVVSCSSQWLITHAFTILLNYRFSNCRFYLFSEFETVPSFASLLKPTQFTCFANFSSLFSVVLF